MTVDDPALGALVARAWELHASETARPASPVVRPSMPILFFGDLDAYRASPRRVITVGLNPSAAEFPASDPWCRFPAMAAPGDHSPDTYLAALSAYFRTQPYSRWFAAFAPLLGGLGASFHAGAESTALHTDLCSPLATSPTWSRLGAARGPLAIAGIPLWHELMAALAPDLIVVSVARLYRNAIAGRATWSEVFRVERARPYVAEMAVITPDDGRRVAVLFGPAAQTPFGTLSDTGRAELGARVSDLLDRDPGASSAR